jgi:hypothetical protein
VVLFLLRGDYMNLEEMIKKVLALIEELNPDSEFLTDDPDIAAKIYYVTNQVMFELARMKKIPQYIEKAVTKGTLIDFAAIEKACGYEVYQINTIKGVNYDSKADGTIYKILEDGTAEIDFYVYPERITEKTQAKAYEFELSNDALEIMPYGIAAHLLLSDVSAEYGAVYAKEYEKMLQRLDPRYHMPSITIEGGVAI